MKKLCEFIRRRMMKRCEHEQGKSNMRTIELNDVEAGIVHSILMTHAELQDNRAIPSMELLARLKRDEPEELDMIDALVDQVNDFEEDSEELRRIAAMFPPLMIEGLTNAIR